MEKQTANENLTRPVRIMIVEHRGRLRAQLQAAFSHSGFNDLVVANNSTEAFIHVELDQQPYDVIVLDCDDERQEMPAATLCHFIRSHAQYCECPIIVIGSELSKNQKALYFRNGADDVLSKPIGAAEIELIACNCLKQRHRAQTAISHN